MSAVMTPAGFTDFKVADISLAAWAAARSSSPNRKCPP